MVGLIHLPCAVYVDTVTDTSDRDYRHVLHGEWGKDCGFCDIEILNISDCHKWVNTAI